MCVAAVKRRFTLIAFVCYSHLIAFIFFGCHFCWLKQNPFTFSIVWRPPNWITWIAHAFRIKHVCLPPVQSNIRLRYQTLVTDGFYFFYIPIWDYHLNYFPLFSILIIFQISFRLQHCHVQNQNHQFIAVIKIFLSISSFDNMCVRKLNHRHSWWLITTYTNLYIVF